MKEEIWKAMPGYENYMVSNLGKVKSLNYNNTGKEKELSPSITNNGYYQTCLYKNGKKENFTIQSLVAMTFLNHIPCGNKLVVDHINSNKSDNRLENLRIIPQRANCSRERTLKSGMPVGVCYYKRTGKYRAQIEINNKQVHLGLFKTPEEASSVYQEALKNITSI